MANLRLDFHESGKGDTIFVTFPDGSLGLIDAYPSPTDARADILEIIGGRPLRFVCLTHPHTDHALDLVRVFQSDVKIDEFWHTNTDIPLFMRNLTKVQNWSSDVRRFALEFERAYANVFIDLYEAVVQKGLIPRQIRAGDTEVIAGVEVHVLSPEQAFQQELQKYWISRSKNLSAPRPDPNVLSAVIALKWGQSVVLLGADALVRNWHTAVPRYRRLGLPKAVVLKVPHHGASNAFKLSNDPRRPNYLDVCVAEERQCKSVLFAGDSDHPDRHVYERLLERTEVHCLINGLGAGITPGEDLGIDMPGASPVPGIQPCQPVVSFEVDPNGNVNLLAGGSCQNCPIAPAV